MTPELKRALRQLGMTLPEAQAFVRLRRSPKYLPGACMWDVYRAWIRTGWCFNGDQQIRYRLTPQGRFVAEALVRLGVNGRKG